MRWTRFLWWVAAGMAPLSVVAQDGVRPSTPTVAIDSGWRAVAAETWKIIADEPAFHLEQARVAFRQGDFSSASANIRIASALMDQRQQILERAQEYLEATADRVDGREVATEAELGQAFAQALDALAGRNWMPVGLVVDEVIRSEPEHHLLRARTHFVRKRYKSAAVDIRKAAVFMQLNSANSGITDGAPAVRREASDLQKLADAVESGKFRSIRRLDQAFKEARQALKTNA